MTYNYMIPVYAYLIKAGVRTIASIPAEYQTPVAQYMAAQAEKA